MSDFRFRLLYKVKPIKGRVGRCSADSEDFELQIPARALGNLKGQKLEKAQQSIIN
jgi:hypothetical protein